MASPVKGVVKKGYLYEGPADNYSVYLEVEVKERACEVARAQGRNLSWLVNQSLRKELGMRT